MRHALKTKLTSLAETPQGPRNYLRSGTAALFCGCRPKWAAPERPISLPQTCSPPFPPRPPWLPLSRIARTYKVRLSWWLNVGGAVLISRLCPTHAGRRCPPPPNFNAIITVIFNHQLHIVHKATRYSRFLYSIFIQTQYIFHIKLINSIISFHH